MQQWTSTRDVRIGPNGSIVTIGKYDAIHIGHQALLKQMVTRAKSSNLESVVLTFSQHPNSVLSPEHVPKPVIGPKLRAEYFDALGVEAVLVLEFNRALAELSARDFVQQYLVNTLNAKAVLVGEGFRFGFHGEGNCETLRLLGEEFNFEVIEVPSQILDGKLVSTTAVREALEKGDVAQVARLLGRKHFTRGVIEHGLKIGRTIGFPTANMSRNAEGYLPLDGVYAGWLIDGENKYPAAISIGINETFQAVPRLAEGFVIDHSGLDLYDHVVDFEYVEFVRPPRKFDGAESLIKEINRDIEKIRAILS